MLQRLLRVVQKTAEATGDLIGNKIADKITSVCRTKSKEKGNQRQEIYISSQKRQQRQLKIVLRQYKNGISKRLKSTRYNI